MSKTNRGRTGLAAAAVALLSLACVRNPTEPDGAGNGSGNGSGNGNGNNVNITLIVNGNVPGSGTGSGSTAGCAAIADIGGKLYGSVDTRNITIRPNTTATMDFTPKDASGNIRAGDCDKNTPVQFAVTQPAGTSICEVLANPSNPYLPSVKGLSPGLCKIKASAGGATTSDEKDVEVTVAS